MAIELPYPTMSGTFTPTGGATIDEFSAASIHDSDTHNNPHSKLLANDVDLDSRLQSLEAGLALTRITPTLVYKMSSSYSTGTSGIPSEYQNTSSTNVGNNGTWQSHSYPVAIPTPCSSVLIKCVAFTGNSSRAYIRLRSVTPSTTFPDDIIVFSWSPANSDDSASDSMTVEMPYNSARTFESYCLGVSSYVCIIFAVGYRS